MLSYILSKMTMLFFLVATVASFLFFRQAFSSFFLQDSAQNLVHRIATNLKHVEGSAKLSETVFTSIPLTIQGGGKRTVYTFNARCVKRGGRKAVIFSVETRKGVLAYDGVEFKPSDRIEICNFPTTPAREKPPRIFIRMEKQTYLERREFKIWACPSKECECEEERETC